MVAYDDLSVMKLPTVLDQDSSHPGPLNRLAVSPALSLICQLALIILSAVDLFLGYQEQRKEIQAFRPGTREYKLSWPISKRPVPTPAQIRSFHREIKAQQKRLKKDPLYLPWLRKIERSRPAVFAIFNRNNRAPEVSRSRWHDRKKSRDCWGMGMYKSPLRACFSPEQAQSDMDDTKALLLEGNDNEDEVERVSALSPAGGDSINKTGTTKLLLLARCEVKSVPETCIEEINLPRIWPSNPSLKNSFRPLTVSKKHTFYCDPCARQTTVQFFLVLLKSNGHYRSYKQSPYHGQTLRTACLLLQDLIYHGIPACKFALVETAADFQTLLVFVDKVRFPQIRGLRKDHLWQFSIEQSGSRGT